MCNIRGERIGLTHVLAVKVRPLIVVIPRFIQLGMPLPPLKPMAQSRRGVDWIVEAQAHPLPHDAIDPSALRAAKALSFE
jgi:hypothetical protein